MPSACRVQYSTEHLVALVMLYLIVFPWKTYALIAGKKRSSRLVGAVMALSQ